MSKPVGVRRGRKAHNIPGNKSNESPQSCIWVDTETIATDIGNETERHTLDFGMACHRRRTVNGVWGQPDWITFKTRPEFWDWLESKTRAKTRLTVFAHNGAFDLPVLDAFSILPDRGWKITRAVVDAPPIDISWRQANKTIRFIDTLNIWRMPLSALGKSVGLRKLRMPRLEEHPARHLAYCRRDVKVIMRACLKWFDFLVDNDLGGFRSTLAGQAFGSYRHRFMKHKITIHNSEQALALERDSYVGGRTECFKLGRHTGEFYYIDVNSMYPSVMKDNLYPHRLSGYYTIVDDEDLSYWRNRYALVCDVELETDVPDYPLSYGGKLVFPVGKFRVSLAGPEFWRAYDAGHVKRVYAAAVYHQADIFTEFVDYFYNKRLMAKRAGDEVSSYSYKILSNSLYGKFGQRGRRFEKIGECNANIVSIKRMIDGDEASLRRMLQGSRYPRIVKLAAKVVADSTIRKFGGIVQEWIAEGESFNSFPAISSYVTSYARIILADAINLAGRGNCYYCDTDSLVVNRQGWESLTHLVDQDRLGAWGLDTVLESIVLHGPKDYVFDGKVVIKGVKSSATWLSADTVSQDMFLGFRSLIREDSLDAPLVKRIIKKQRRVYTKGTPDTDNNILPLEIGV
jgi:hypothetical protein